MDAPFDDVEEDDKGILLYQPANGEIELLECTAKRGEELKRERDEWLQVSKTWGPGKFARVTQERTRCCKLIPLGTGAMMMELEMV